MTAPIRGLIFDMDGTIVDNMRYHDDAWEAWHGHYGLPFDRPNFFARTAGRTNPEILRDLFPQLDEAEIIRRGEEKEAIYRRLYAPHVALMPGLAALLDHADTLGLGMAVGTAAPPDNIAVVLDSLAIRHRFRTVVSPSQGFRGKPHPDVFLAAAERMGLPPESCIVFEDAPLGVEAARRAGMRAVAVETMLTREAFGEFDNLVAAFNDFTHALPLIRAGARAE